MMEKKTRKKRDRMPQVVINAVVDLIRNGAKTLDADDANNLGYDTEDVVDRVEAAATREAKGYGRIVFRDWIAKMVPHVLGSVPERRSAFWQPLLPNVLLPAYFSIPPERDENGKAIGQARWKRDRKATPDELGRVEDHLRAAIDGRQTTLQQIVVVRQTALRRGCDPSDPISTVLDDDTSGRLPDDRPQPAA